MDSIKEQYQNKNIIGADETGVGDYFTTLVGAAVYLTYQQALTLVKLGVKDSKTLSEKQIWFFEHKIKELVPYQIHHLTPRGYNVLNKSFNAHELKTLIHLTTISKLEQKYPVDEIILDKYVEQSSWNKYCLHLNQSSLKIPLVKKKIIFLNRAEQEHVAVAAASILARAFMLRKLQLQNKKWETVFPLGVGKKVEDFGKIFVKNHGANSLFEVCKIKFKTTKNILNNSKNTSLEV